jgi:hypothetical protein
MHNVIKTAEVIRANRPQFKPYGWVLLIHTVKLID